MDAFQTFLLAALFGLVVSLCLVFYRVLRGPTAPDRVLAGDTAVSMIVALMVLLGVYHEEAIMLDVALLLVFLSFIGTLAISKYLEKRGLGD
ncbi:cation:proton antiporter [Candidatus Hecatella orcuttiae]|jgi:multisubunit Na+/H+ antiporter MnhF subunit|uniref:cation:proton antiporter n=1 Tax=Candidatus Hecatella orcuttiae TaxID=1935119 RepID=UPI00286804CB|nr:cation:proton antiporter [Candidatus Hecatella orcuttiae]